MYPKSRRMIHITCHVVFVFLCWESLIWCFTYSEIAVTGCSLSWIFSGLHTSLTVLWMLCIFCTNSFLDKPSANFFTFSTDECIFLWVRQSKTSAMWWNFDASSMQWARYLVLRHLLPFSGTKLTFELRINFFAKSCKVLRTFIPFAVLLSCLARGFLLEGFIAGKTHHTLLCSDKDWNEISLQNYK